MLLVGAFAWAAIAAVSPLLAEALAWVLDLLASPFRLLPHLPSGAWLSLPADGSWITGCAFALWGFAFTVRALPRRLVVLAPLLLAGGSSPGRDTGEVELLVADVGQGDGLLLRAAEKSVLVDGGGIRGRDLAAQVWLPLLARRGVTALDAMAVTHADTDHCGGLVDVAVHLPVRELWGPEAIRESACVRELLAWSGATWRGLVAGERVDAGPLRLAVVAPASALAPAESNDASLVMRLEAQGRRVLLTGDLDGEAEARLVAGSASELACDILKVGHHGSARGTSAALLAAASPRLAVVSAGKGNRFGHPAAALLARLERAGVRLLRTDLQGAISIRWRADGALRIELPGSPRDFP
jgi:competence protein ComEC